MDDLISRQAAIDIANDIRDCISVDGYWAWMERLKKLPSADPVKHGMWLTWPHKRARICSRCEADEPYKCADEDADVFDYCPHCGAKMDERR